MKALDPRERRILALGLLVGVIAVIWLALISPLLSDFQNRSRRREESLAQYRTNQRLLASIPALRATAFEQRRTAALYQITAPSQGVAVEALEQRLAASLTESGGTVSAVQQIQADVPPGWISVRADAQIDLTQLATSIRRLENEAPYVVVEYASLSADRALRSGEAAPLDVRLQILALFHSAPAR